MSTISLNKIFASRNNLERILDNLKDGIIAHDLNRNIFYFNKMAEKITGYNRSDVVGKDCHIAMGGPFCGDSCSFCGKSPDIHGNKEYEVIITTKSGKQSHIEMSVTPIDDENGETFGVLASFKDITEILDLRLIHRKVTGYSNIIGQDNKMIQVFKQIRNVSEYDYPVHIYGETGTGKELVAAAIHNESRRRNAPFVPINCGALPEGLIESELFGHVKGAFSGAIRDRKGRFELAGGGTVFLDEVAELSKPMQVKLLRFLQESTFERVGGEKTIKSDTRIISATNKDLKKEVQRGTFREDLFYRLNVIPIMLPPLRKRKMDIPVLITHFLHQAAESNDEKKLMMSDEAMSLLVNYQWPGNVRELQNAIQYAIVKSTGKIIVPDDLPLEFREQPAIRPKRGPSASMDINAIEAALKKAGGNKAKAAKLMGIGRATLYRYINKHPEIMNGLP
ncbi:MAG: sigma 54-interacting transcriptional regulator [Desulfobacterales bacterium]|nr:sigma 54-interacting transcriptional regulator [Desulfobacterales bacterium]